MGLNLKEIKGNEILEKLKGFLQKNKKEDDQKWGTGSSAASKGSLRRGIDDIKAVIQEGKASLFLKQGIVFLVAFLIVRYAGKGLTASADKIRDNIAKQNLEQTHKDEYLANKEHLLKLEILFPDISKKKDWMLLRLNDIFEKHNMKVNVDGNFSEENQRSYVVGLQAVSFQAGFKEVGRLLSDIENGDDFLRVTEFSISKLTDGDHLGENTVNIRFATAYPQNKYAPSLFKDYSKRMEQLQPKQQSSAEQKARTSTERK